MKLELRELCKNFGTHQVLKGVSLKAESGTAVGLLGVSVIGIGVLAARIYRVGVLLYGTAPKPAELLRMIRKG